MEKLCSSRTRNFNLIMAGIAFGGILSVAGVCPAQEYIWAQKTDMPTPRWTHASSVVNGKIYVIGGVPSEPTQGMRLFVVEMYDPSLDKWTRKADMPTPRGYFSTCVVDGKIYAIGGTYNAAYRIVEEYDPVSDTWTRRRDMPTARTMPTTCALNGKIYVIGGMLWENSSGAQYVGLPTVEVYDPAKDTWASRADMPDGWLWGASTSVVNGKIYRMGGGRGATSRVWEYEPARDTWTPKSPMLVTRRNFATCVLDGKIHAIGGWGSSAGQPKSSVEVYDPKLDLWTPAPDMPIGKACLSANVVSGKIYIFGGTDRPHDCLATSTVYELSVTPPPSPDFNRDGIVDSADVRVMVDHWHTDHSACDIAPTPSGDGIVDVQDLTAFAEHLFEDYRLVAHWTFDEEVGETAHDSANWYAGTVHGGAVRHVEGKVGGALRLDGIDDYVSTPYLLNPGTRSFSAFAWVKTEVPGQAILSQAGSTGNAWLRTDLLDGRLVTELTAPLFPPLESEYVVTDDQWHHVGLVYDRDNFRRLLYIDAVEVCSDTEIVAAMSSTGGLHIGVGGTLDPASYFSGAIDDFRVYNQALTAEDIEALMQ